MGAEKRAPPGMGSNPIRAGMTEPTIRASFERRVKLSTSLFICPELSMRRLMINRSPIMATRLRVCKLDMAARAPLINAPDPSPVKRASSKEPMSRERLNWTRSLLRIKIRLKTRNILRMAGMVQNSL